MCLATYLSQHWCALLKTEISQLWLRNLSLLGEPHDKTQDYLRYADTTCFVVTACMMNLGGTVIGPHAKTKLVVTLRTSRTHRIGLFYLISPPDQSACEKCASYCNNGTLHPQVNLYKLLAFCQA